MDLDKIVAFISNHAAEQFSTIAQTLWRPSVVYRPIHVSSDRSGNVLAAEGPSISSAMLSERPAPEVFIFFAINLAVGTVINKLVPARKEGPDLLTTLCVSFGMAFFAGLLLHVFCKLLGGRGSFWMTVSAYLQVSSTLFVVASLCALFWGAIMKPPQILDFVERYSSNVVFLGRNPILMFFLSQFLLQAFYMPLALVSVHGFGYWKSAIVAWTFVMLGVAFSILLYLSTGLTKVMGDNLFHVDQRPSNIAVSELDRNSIRRAATVRCPGPRHDFRR